MSIRFTWKETVVVGLFYSPIILIILLQLTTFNSRYEASVPKESQVAKASDP